MSFFVDQVLAALGADGALARALPGWEHRPEQAAMARAVAIAIEDERPLLVEAGTGTGKTLAYLVPAILSGKTVLISTATRTLQEQLAQKDLPLLAAHLGVEFTSAVLKGISNYLCVRRLAEIGQTHDPDLLQILDWSRRTRSGDRGELTTVAEDAPAWRQATTTPDARLGPRCPFFERCFVTQARRAAGRAQIIIVNHHLYFADAALRAHSPGSGVLPDHDAVIFDEAHALEEIATEHFGIAVSTTRLTALLRDAGRVLDSRSDPLLANLDVRGAQLFRALATRLGGLASGPLFGNDGARVTAPDDLFAGERREGWLRLDAALDELAAHAKRAADDDSAAPDEAASAVARRAHDLRDDLATLAEPDARARHVHWGELRGHTVHLHASPIDVAPLFRKHVLSRGGPAIFTSATLAAGQPRRLDFTRARLGLEAGEAEELAVDSPFDFAKQAMLYLPRDLPFPDEPGFADAALERIAALCEITKGRAFILFTSRRALRHAATVLRPKLPYPVLVQGEAPRAALLDEFRRLPGSVLFATSSFWEGVDIPGAALSLVVLEKLPFAPPDDPLSAARAARLAAAGEDPFQTYHLPRAALALKQGFGRLIRRRDDRGIVAVLDGRIVTRNYGLVFLATLPPAARTSALEQVRRWW